MPGFLCDPGSESDANEGVYESGVYKYMEAGARGHVVLIDIELTKDVVDLGLGHLVSPGLEGVYDHMRAGSTTWKLEPGVIVNPGMIFLARSTMHTCDRTNTLFTKLFWEVVKN